MNFFRRFFIRQFKKNEIALHELNYLFWECTLRCNLNCLHCGSDCHQESNTSDMPFKDFLNAILPLKKHSKPNTVVVVFMGGEPLLRKDIAQCGEELINNGFQWGMVTNGYYYTADKHAELMSSGMSSITVSLDGLEAEHNWLRNNNKSFHKAVDAIQKIADTQGLMHDVVTCVHKKNIATLENIYQLLQQLKVKQWRLFTISPIGRAENNLDLQLNHNELKYLMNFIVEKRKMSNSIHVKFSCEAYTGSYEEKVRDSFFFCRAGVNIASVLADGSISGCPNIHRGFTQGNIYTDDLWTIWNTKFDLMRNRNWAKEAGKCAHCSSFKDCNGGAMHLWNPDKPGIISCIHQSIITTQQ